MYAYEKKKVAEQVEATISDVADSLQWYNGSQLSNFAAMLTDKEYDSKLSFAAGFTHNKGKFTKVFFDDDTLPKLAKAPGAGTNIISPAFLTRNNITFKPSAAMTIRQFDSLFKIALHKKHLNIRYSIYRLKHADTVASPDLIVSSPFIIDFFAPRMYSVLYYIPRSIVLGHILPYLLSNLLVCALLILSALFLARSYRLKLQAYEFRESLLGNITHEFKTPITSMQLIVDSAKKSISDSDTVLIPSRHVLYAEDELARMKVIVDRMLAFNKMSRGQFAFIQERVDLDDVVLKAIRLTEINVQQAKGIVEYASGSHIIIPGDPVLLTNVVAALIDNAIKYTNKPPVIHISLAMEGKNAVIAVQDNGIGIRGSAGKKIFEPFFRIPTGNVYNAAGHGLGLSFARQLMELHKGSIHFRSSESGTTFYLTFKVL